MSRHRHDRTSSIASHGRFFSAGAMVLAGIISFAILCATPVAKATVTVVARTGTQAPGESVGTNFRAFNGIEIANNAGKVVFSAYVTQFLDPLDGIWINDGMTTLRVAKAGTQAPGLPTDVKFAHLSVTAGAGPYLDDVEQVTFRGVLKTGTHGVTTNNNVGIWQGPASSVIPIYRTGTAAPDTPAGTLFSDFDGLVANSGGQIAFKGFLQAGGGVNASNDVGIWTGSPSTGLRILAREGSIAPGAGGGRIFQASESVGDVMPYSSLQLSTSGQVVFAGRLNDDTRGIWIGDADGVDLVALGNTQAPGLPTGAFFDKTSLGRSDVRRYQVSSQGNFGFTSLLMTGAGGVTSANQHGLWARINGAMSLVAREGEQAPGLTDGVFFSNSGANPFTGTEVNDGGAVAFVASIAGAGISAGNNSEGIWTGEPDSLQPVVQQGEVAPGAPSGFTFSNILTRPVLNELGQFAFLADTRSVSGSQSLRGLWAWDPTIGLLKIAMEGDVLELAPGVTRTVSMIQGNLDASFANARSLNDHGQLAFLATFTDGSQAILIAPVPEPATGLLLACGALMSALRVRQLS